MTPDASRVQHLLELGRFVEAGEALRPLLAEAPGDPDLHGLRAQVCLGLDDLDGALEAGGTLSALAPEEEWAHRIRAIALRRMGRAEEATQAAGEAVRLAPLSWQTHHVYAQVALGARGMGRHARAAAHRAVQLAPHEADAHYAVGLVAQELLHDAEAVTAYQRALALDPHHAAALHNLTHLQGGVGLRRRARGLGAALGMSPGDEAMRGSVDRLAVRFVLRLYLLAALGLVGGLSVSTDGGSGEVSPASVGVGVGLLVATTGYAWSLARGVPVGIRRYVAERMRRDPFLVTALFVVALVVATALACCLVPRGADLALLLLRPLGFASVGLLVWGTLRTW